MSHVAVVLALCALLAGCGAASPGPSEAPLPPKPTIVEVNASEYRFDRDKTQRIREGRVVFRVRNAGRREHQVVLLDVPEDLPRSLDEQLHSRQRRATLPLAILPNRRPGQIGAFAVDLPAGRYGIVCFLKTPDGKSHALKGMNSELRVQ